MLATSPCEESNASMVSYGFNGGSRRAIASGSDRFRARWPDQEASDMAHVVAGPTPPDLLARGKQNGARK